MINSIKNNKIDDPKYLELSDTLNDKYAEKEAFEESDITKWTRLLYLVPHVLIAGGTIGLIQFINVSKVEKIFLTVFIAALALALEWFKGVYMERYFIANLKTQDVEQPRETRQFNQKKKGVNFKILAFFWAISALIFCFTGSQLAKKVYGTAEKISYDASIENSLVVATNALNKATKESAGSGTLRNLSEKLENARNAWSTHKKEIAQKNATIVTYHDDDIFNYSVMAFSLCLILEIGLFAARGFHETKQYEIHKSLNGIGNPINLQIQQNNSQSIDYAREIEKLKTKIGELKDALKVKDETIQFYKDKNNILLSESKLNGQHSKP